MTVRSCVLAACAIALFGATARAKPIAFFTGSISTTDNSQLGRPSRSGVQQTWTGQETYTGILNPTTTYFYRTYDFAASLFVGAPYVDVSAFDSTNSALLFVTAYANSYDPANRGANWLGDQGSSGNFTFAAGTLGDPRYFDLVLPSDSSLVLVVNTTGGGSLGTGLGYEIAINAYSDTNFSAPTPEPASWLMLGTGLLGVTGALRRRSDLAPAESAAALPDQL